MQRKWARVLTMITIGIFAVSITFAGSTNSLKPGPMATSHASVEDCSSCHSGVKPGPVGWVNSIFAAADPHKDSMACITCHRIDSSAMNPHSANLETLERKTNRIQSTKVAPTQVVDRLREAVFPVRKTFQDGVFCQTCHKEHKGAQFDLNSMPDHRCQACHTVEIHSFAEDHPEFGSYPFRRRTRIFFDHVSHFAKHFPEEKAKQASSAPLPQQCNDCHTVGSDNRHMDVKPFEQVCSACHLGQIVGNDRPEGPKGVALMTLPGLDVETLESKGADIGEWPAESDADVTPFMEMLIGRDDERKKILAAVKDIDLLDLSDQPDDTIAAVQALAWEVKDLFHTYSTSMPSAVTGRLNTSAAVKTDPQLVAKLMASMPRDVLMGAQRQWLPNLESELKTYRSKQAGNNADGATASDQTGKAESSENTDDQENADAADPTDQELEEPVEEPEQAVDAETWAEFGGWYRQDYSILYKPTGHEDEFMKAWLDLSGRSFADQNGGGAAATFNLLSKDGAQGQCTKCHSIDAAKGGARQISWKPSASPLPAGRFTVFSHGPHLSVVGKEGCLTCHKLNPAAQNQATYKQIDPAVFDSNFHPVDKQTCTTCHRKQAVRDDCLLCHSYHATEVSTPFPATKLPDK